VCLLCSNSGIDLLLVVELNRGDLSLLLLDNKIHEIKIEKMQIINFQTNLSKKLASSTSQRAIDLESLNQGRGSDELHLQ
jgi:uncharacterized protein YqkB